MRLMAGVGWTALARVEGFHRRDDSLWWPVEPLRVFPMAESGPQKQGPT